MSGILQIFKAKPTYLTLMVALLFKLGMWTYYGPTKFNDTAVYEGYANLLLQEDWSWQERLLNSAIPTTGLRTIGYPAIIALAKAVAGAHWSNLVVGLQIALSLISVVMVTNWTLNLPVRPVFAVLTGITVALGQSALFDISILPDSLFSSIAIIALCAMATRKPRESLKSMITTAFGIGLGASAMCLLRGNGIHIVFMFLPLAAVWTLQARSYRLYRALALLLPIIVIVQAYIFWNQSRTGHRFISTGAQIVAFQPLYEMAQRGANVFTDDSILSRTVRETTTSYDYSDISTLNLRLAEKYGWTAIDIANAGTQALVGAALHEPFALLRNAGRAFGFSVIRSILNPALTIAEAHHMITEDRLFPGVSKIFKSLSEQRPATIAYAIVTSLGSVISTVLFASFLFTVPFRCISSVATTDRSMVLSIWIGIVGMLAYYSLIHLEIRYILATFPFVAGLGFWALPLTLPRLRSDPAG